MELAANAVNQLIELAKEAVESHSSWRGEILPEHVEALTPKSVLNSIGIFWHSLTPHSLRLVKNGRIHPKTRLSIHRPDFKLAEVMAFSEIGDLYSKGYTIIYRQLASRYPAFSSLSNAVCRSFSAWPTVNIYLTPGEGHGFAEHSDHHDVLIIHCYGSKTWTLSSRGEDAREFILDPGNILFFPEGVRHRASAKKEPCVHITLGFRPPSMDQFLIFAGERLRTPGCGSQYLDVNDSAAPDEALDLCKSLWAEYLSASRCGFGRAIQKQE